MLIITRQFPDTASNIARERIELECALGEGHDGPHEDSGRGERWEDRGSPLTHLLRDEEEHGSR